MKYIFLLFTILKHKNIRILETGNVTCSSLNSEQFLYHFLKDLGIDSLHILSLNDWHS